MRDQSFMEYETRHTLVNMVCTCLVLLPSRYQGIRFHGIITLLVVHVISIGHAQ